MKKSNKVSTKRKKHPIPSNSDNDTDKEDNLMDISLIEALKYRIKRNAEKQLEQKVVTRNSRPMSRQINDSVTQRTAAEQNNRI